MPAAVLYAPDSTHHSNSLACQGKHLIALSPGVEAGFIAKCVVVLAARRYNGIVEGNRLPRAKPCLGLC